MEVQIKTCPKCAAQECTKDGVVASRQRYKCKACNYRYTVEHRGFDPSIKRQALILYLLGLGFRPIARILQCSHGTVYNWIKSYGDGIEDIRSQSDVAMVSVDELCEQITDKQQDAEKQLLLIDFENYQANALCVTKSGAKVGMVSHAMNEKDN